VQPVLRADNLTNLFMFQIVTHRLLRKVLSIGVLNRTVPLELKRSVGFNDFKHKLKLVLLDHPSYVLHGLFLRNRSKYSRTLIQQLK
jgi:hypothetical protein